MKKIVLAAITMIMATTTTFAQKLMIGEKAPEIKIKEWLVGKQPKMEDKPILVEFFHTSSAACIARLEVLDKMVDTYKSRIEIVLLAKEDKGVIIDKTNPAARKFAIGLDDAGKTFTNYDTQFVPFGVLIDKKGRVAWFGNPKALTTATISSVLE